MLADEKIYNRYLEGLRKKLIKKYDELGLRASGEYEESLDPQTKNHALTMWAAKHSIFMEHGRGPGGFPPRSKIEEWIENKKGLPQVFKEKKKQFAFLIARKIANEGIKVPNKYNKGKVVSDVVDSFLAEDLFKMTEELGVMWVGRIRSDVIKILKP